MATRLDDNIEINLDFQQFEDEEPEQHSLTINETANRNTGEGDPFCHVPKTNFEKLMCVICAFLLLTLIITLSFKGVSKTTETTEEDICMSEGCIAAAAQYLVNMDTSADPCEDFWQYACGGWMDTYEIPSSKSRYTHFGQIDERNKVILKRILESDPKPGYEKIYDLYNSCMDMDTLNTLGVAPILDQWAQMRWSTSTGDSYWGSEDWSGLAKVMSLSLQFGISETPFFNVYNGVDDMDSSQYKTFIGQSGITLPDYSYYLKDDIATNDNYLALQETIKTQWLLVDPDAQDIESRAAAIANLEKKLAENYLTHAEERDPYEIYNLKTMDELKAIMPFFPWEDFFNTAFNRKTISDAVVTHLGYMEKLQKVITNESKNTVMDYLQWRLLVSHGRYLNQDMLDARFEYSKSVYGVKSQEQRDDLCAEQVDGRLGFMLGKLFVDQSFSGDSMTIIGELLSEVEEAFKHNIENLDWMEDVTKIEAKEKLAAMGHKIGYPVPLSNFVELLDEYYQDFSVGNAYYQNINSHQTYDWNKNVNRIGQPVDKTEWSMTPPTVNAYNSFGKNEIVFPAGILQKYFFDATFLGASNYGAVGQIMGHEITHGFDDSGAKYDKTGSLGNWWDSNTQEQFDIKKKCIEDQYSGYQVETSEGMKNVNGTQTLGENIADNGGLKAAYVAFENFKAKRDSSSSTKLPGLDFTEDQLFFISFGGGWCGKQTPEHTLSSISSDPHSPHDVRVKGTLSNSKYFAKAFNCPSGSAMNPVQKCEVW